MWVAGLKEDQAAIEMSVFNDQIGHVEPPTHPHRVTLPPDVHSLKSSDFNLDAQTRQAIRYSHQEAGGQGRKKGRKKGREGGREEKRDNTTHRGGNQGLKGGPSDPQSGAPSLII